MENTREIGVTINRYKKILVEEIAVKEEMLYIEHDIIGSRITLGTRFLNSSSEVIKENTIFITGDNYDLLLSDSSVFGEGKQQGSFKDSDLWYVIDKIRKEAPVK